MIYGEGAGLFKWAKVARCTYKIACNKALKYSLRSLRPVLFLKYIRTWGQLKTKCHFHGFFILSLIYGYCLLPLNYHSAAYATACMHVERKNGAGIEKGFRDKI